MFTCSYKKQHRYSCTIYLVSSNGNTSQNYSIISQPRYREYSPAPKHSYHHGPLLFTFIPYPWQSLTCSPFQQFFHFKSIYEWNHTVCNLFPTQHNSLDSHPSCFKYQVCPFIAKEDSLVWINHIYLTVRLLKNIWVVLILGC